MTTYLLELHVRREWQNKGLGSALLHAIPARDALHVGAVGIAASVLHENADAIRFYRRHGLRPVHADKDGVCMFARAGVHACARSDVQAESGVHAVNLAAGLWSELLGAGAQHTRSAAAARTHTHTASNVTATPSSCTGAAAPGEITHALTLRSAQLTYALLRGPKCIENRDFRMQPGWYALHTGEQTEPLASQRPLLAKMQSLPLEADLPHSAIVGAIRVSHTLTLGQCTADAWAFGPMCNVVDASISLDTPIQHTGALSV